MYKDKVSDLPADFGSFECFKNCIDKGELAMGDFASFSKLNKIQLFNFCKLWQEIISL